jgi:hypothetical protein
MNIDQMFKKYPENLIGFRVNQSVNIIDYWLDPNWSILDEHVGDEIQIKKQKTSEETGFVYYTMFSQLTSLDGLYEVLSKIIEYNIDLQRKQQLFTQKMGELKDIFGKLDYDELRYLSFDAPALITRKITTEMVEPNNDETNNNESNDEEEIIYGHDLEEEESEGELVIENDSVEN